MKPFPYQQKSIDEIFESFKVRNRQMYYLPTGGGKTVIFSFVSKRFVKEYKKKVLIIVHRDELVGQTTKTLRKIGVTCESVVADKKKLQHVSDAYVAMVETLKNRLDNDPDFVKDIGLVIFDEAHIDQFRYFLDFFDGAKLLPCTGTPISQNKLSFSKCSVCNKEYEDVRMCCNYETYEYTKRFHYSLIYDHIILGPSISELILNGNIVRDLNYEAGNVDRSKFSIDSKTGDFDQKSTDQYFGNYNVVKNYEHICFGEKTMIFCGSTKVNKKCYDDFIEAGYENVRMFDSKNSKKSDRKPLLEWFKNTPDAILINCGVFTTGFDEPTLQTIILNRSTLSLSLLHQMIGRAGRTCDTIYKPHCKVIDLGGNLKYFGEKYNNSGKWSDEYPWEQIFYGEDEKPKAKKEPLDQTKSCKECGAIVKRTDVSCEYCGEVFRPPKEKTESSSDEVAKLIDAIPLPDGKKIVQYVEKIGRDRNFAWLIFINQTLDLFIRHQVTFGTYKKTEENGKFNESIRRILKEPYTTIQGSELPGTNMRTKAWIVNKIKNKLDIYYSKNATFVKSES